jgi:copper(I)-binding protein
MLRTRTPAGRDGVAGLPGRRASSGSAAFRPGRRALKSAAGGIAMLGACLAAGCAAPVQAGPVIQLSSAQVVEPNSSGITEIYVDVQNNGPADRIISAKLSVRGELSFRSPVKSGVFEMRTVPSILIPARSFVRLAPNSSHLLVTDSGPMKAGTEITLTLVFAHAGAFSVPTMVTNPETGGSSYFLN